MNTPLKQLVVGLVLLVLDFQIPAQVAFAPIVSYGVGYAPDSLVVADVNGDGKMDLICANRGSVISPTNTLSILTNNGSGLFGYNATCVVGSAPYSVTTADVYGDGHVDLISANFIDSTLSVLTNNGTGYFGSNATYKVGKFPCSVVAADVNGDGHVDIICANSGDHSTTNSTLMVLTNNGSGVFGSNATYAVGYDPVSVIAADVNGDGHVDLICANLRGSSLSIFKNDGSGGFLLASTLTTTQPNSVIAADVNGDGHVDLICANYGYGTLSVFTNNGGGGFVFTATCNVGYQPQSVSAADVNGDGHVDLICANMGIYQFPGNILINGNTLSVLTNDGSGSFALASTLNVGSGPNSVFCKDVNGDGKVDLICANGGDGTLSVLINVPTPVLNRSISNAVVTWPSGWTNWGLQQNADLTTTNWAAMGWPVTDDGTNNSVTVPAPASRLFFRLLHP